MNQLIQADKWYHLQDNRGQQKISRITNGKNKLKWRKVQIELSQLIGFPLNQVFRVDGSQIVVENNVDQFYFPNEGEDELIDSDSEGDKDNLRDNRNRLDTQNNQKLSTEEIQLLKMEKQPGDEIVKKIVTNSETFATRNEYSQIKYLKRKKEKYQFLFIVQLPTLDLLQTTYYLENPAKINFLRSDVLAFFLQLAGIKKGSQILMFDNTFGLALAGVAERLGGSGTLNVIFSHLNKSQIKNVQPLQSMNFDKKIWDSMIHLKAEQIIESENKYDKILIAGEFNYLDILKEVHQKLNPSGLVVIFSSFLEVNYLFINNPKKLAEASEFFQGQQTYSNPLIFDSFYREQQVLENRTHPKLEMNPFGGYLLQTYRLE